MNKKYILTVLQVSTLAFLFHCVHVQTNAWGNVKPWYTKPPVITHEYKMPHPDTEDNDGYDTKDNKYICDVEDVYKYSSDEVGLLEKLVASEAGNQDITGKRLVVSVVLNRVDHEDYPDNIYDVLYQSGQFTVIDDGSFDGSTPDDDCKKAVQLELKHRSDYSILYFRTGKYSEYGTRAYKYQDHYFSTE